MNLNEILKAIADDTRLKIITLLLQRNYCVRAIARKLNISEAAVSQHLKILREAGLVSGEKIGYFVHYNVNKNILLELAGNIESLAGIERANCSSEEGGCEAGCKCRKS